MLDKNVYRAAWIKLSTPEYLQVSDREYITHVNNIDPYHIWLECSISGDIMAARGGTVYRHPWYQVVGKNI